MEAVGASQARSALRSSVWLIRQSSPNRQRAAVTLAVKETGQSYERVTGVARGMQRKGRWSRQASPRVGEAGV